MMSTVRFLNDHFEAINSKMGIKEIKLGSFHLSIIFTHILYINIQLIHLFNTKFPFSSK